jgi:diaminopimelate decarboxylase
VPLPRIAAEVGTPTYVYSYETLARHYRVFDEALARWAPKRLICYAMKACPSLGILGALGKLGAGADTVSAGEIFRARRAGIPADKIVFSGVGKRRDEMVYALAEGIHAFNVESEMELELLARVAAEAGRRAPVSVRVNPDVDAATHPYISTGLKQNKFGVPVARARALYRRAAELPSLEVMGLDCHIGSQLTQTQPFVDAIAHLCELVLSLVAEGMPVRSLDIGGGLGIPYQAGADIPSPAEYADAIGRALAPLASLELTIVAEPGRVIVGNAGVLLTEVLYLKDGEDKRFVIVDAAMNDLLRPVLYGAHHDLWSVRRDAPSSYVADVVGPICETGDFLARDRELGQRPAAGDLLAVMAAGAYAFAMSSNYNSRPRAAEVMVRGDRYEIIRARETLDDLVRGERVPDYL